MFDPGKPFQPSLMFVDEARSLPWSEPPERCFTWVGSSEKSFNEIAQNILDIIYEFFGIASVNFFKSTQAGINYVKKSFFLVLGL